MKRPALTIFLAILVSYQRKMMAQSSSSGVDKIPLPFDVDIYSVEFVANYSRFLHNHHRFDSFVIFCENCKDFGPSLEQVLMQEFQTALIVWGGAQEANFHQQLGLNNLVFVFVASLTDPILKVASVSLTGLHFTSVLVIFKDLFDVPPTTTGEIRQFFEWCWQQNIVNVALTFQVRESSEEAIHNQVFSYTPFPHMEVYNLTDQVYEPEGDFIQGHISDTRGYEFNTPIFMDPPTVFLTPYERHHARDYNLFITGTAGRIFHEFAHFLNASINISVKSNVSFYSYHMETLLMAAQGLIDMGIHPYSGLLPYANQTEGSYPIGQTNACIIVPLIPEIEHSEYLLRTMDRTIWLVLVLEWLCLFGMQCLHLRSFNLGRALLYAYGSLLSQPLGTREFDQRKAVLRALHLLVITVSVMVGCVFCASLTSLLSATLVGEQIQTAEDLLRSGLMIMVNRHEKEVYFDTNILPRKLMKRLYLVNETFVELNKNSLNTAYAYVATAQEWKKLNFQQQLLWKPRFRIAHGKLLCTANHFLRFPMQWDSPFQKSLVKYYFTVLESGLRKVWEDRSIYHATKLNLIYIMNAGQREGLYFEWRHLQKPIMLCGAMLTVATVCFVLELFWHRRDVRRRTPSTAGLCMEE